MENMNLGQIKIGEYQATAVLYINKKTVKHNKSLIVFSSEDGHYFWDREHTTRAGRCGAVQLGRGSSNRHRCRHPASGLQSVGAGTWDSADIYLYIYISIHLYI